MMCLFHVRTSNDYENVAKVYGLGAFKVHISTNGPCLYFYVFFCRIPVFFTTQNVRAEAEQRVYEKLNQKMDEFLDLGNILIIDRFYARGWILDDFWGRGEGCSR